MIAPNIKLVGDKVLAATLEATARTKGEKVQRVVTRWGHILEGHIKSRAPVKTGDYRRSWNTQMQGLTAVIGTNKPQARRLEYGFVGADSLGRHYNQAPRPHVRPSVDEVRDPYLRDLAKAMRPR